MVPKVVQEWRQSHLIKQYLEHHFERRVRTLRVVFPRQAWPGPLHVVVDATALKIYGEGEWKVRQQGAGRRQTWRKVHLAADADAKGIIEVEVTTTD